MSERDVTEILWCGRNPKAGRDGWSFPKEVRRRLIADTAGMSVLHLFGGKADFGIRMDIDPGTRPDVVGDAWLPPFRSGSFDVVILDPPYVGEFSSLSNQKVLYLFAAAADIARKWVIWFHTVWLNSPARCKLEKGYLVHVGRSCAVRCLQYFAVSERKLKRFTFFERGPAMKYNRWLQQPQGLPFGEGGITV